jgi:DNA sulfur modification protein DndC
MAKRTRERTPLRNDRRDRQRPSAVLQLVWNALRELPPEQRTKPIHVISTDTLVEQPLVAAWVETSLARMREAAQKQGLSLTPHKLTPEVEDSFWVNLIGKGYPAPRPKFRWCTERLKIRPSNKFIRDVVRANGEALLVLGTRKAESQRRAATMTKHETRRVRDRLSPNVSLPSSLVYSPIEDWSNDDVWLYLMQVKNPWGHDNKSLLGMYQGASEGGECPLVVDASTPSCGTSRFGCWVCTVVDKDRSMEAMIKNDEEKVWMMPLLELRNELDKPDDRDRRDYRRLNGRIQLFHDRTIPGPYTNEWRERWLRGVLAAAWVNRRLFG